MTVGATGDFGYLYAMRASFIPFFACLLFCAGTALPQTPLANAHAHNDYEHRRPLLDALSHGFTSVEADVHLINGELLVSHNKPLFSKSVKTLQELYLSPLDSVVKANQGRVYPGYEATFYLMIDFKSDAGATYKRLLEVIEPFTHLLAPQGPVTVFISGNRPLRQILSDTSSPVALDGRPNDLMQGVTAEKMPVVSTSFKSLGYWNGNGEVPLDIQLKIRQLCDGAHKEGKKVRLWDTPEDPKVWAVLLHNGVDLLNADDLIKLKNFLADKK